MIIDHIRNWNSYFSLPARFARAFSFLKRLDFQTLRPGRNDIEGDSLFAMCQEYETKSPGEGKWESHRSYADIQYVAGGEELIGYAPLESMIVREAYRQDSDCAFYHGAGDFIRLRQGQFGIFLPQDVHMPGIAVGGPSPVRKVVVKVLL